MLYKYSPVFTEGYTTKLTKMDDIISTENELSLFASVSKS